MKHGIYKLIFSLLMVFLLAGCGSSGYEGLWIGTFYGEEASLYLSGVRGIFTISGYSDVGMVNMSGNTGTIRMYGDVANISISGNTLTLTEGPESITFTRSTGRAAPSQINGTWEGPRGWTLIFVNDRVYVIDDDGDVDHGTFTFASNSGTFSTGVYSYTMAFTVSGNTLSGQMQTFWGSNENLSFTR